MSPQRYAEDVWDYLGDLPKFPHRSDRDALLSPDDPRRARIWDYFFQVPPQGIGKPQQDEIWLVRSELDSIAEEHKVQVNSIQAQQVKTSGAYNRKIRRDGIGGLFTVILGTVLAFLLLYQQNMPPQNVLVCGGLFWALGFGALTFAGIRFIRLHRYVDDIHAQIEALEDKKKARERAARDRIVALELEIEALRQQIPKPPSGAQVRAWLDQDLEAMFARSVALSDLGQRLVPVAELNAEGGLRLVDNPICVLAPAELQEETLIPKTFARQVNPDLNKHLYARRAYTLADGAGVDVLFGVYFIKYIALAQDMLVTVSLFYDFITGQASGGRVTEQYYRDIVAITTASESRRILQDADSAEPAYIDDLPTFKISLAGSETRELTYVNQDYFLALMDTLGLTLDQVGRIHWIAEVDNLVKDTMALLRRYLQLHKGEEGDK